MTFSSEIYRRLHFRMNILDYPEERISVQEIELSVATRKRRISVDLSQEDSNSVSLGELEKAVRRSPLMKRDRRKSKMLKMLLLVPNFFPSGGYIMLWRVLSFDRANVILPLVHDTHIDFLWVLFPVFLVDRFGPLVQEHCL